MSNCDIVGTAKPVVWKDDYGWNCDQTTVCLSCNAASFDRLAEEATWPDALRASVTARCVKEPNT